MNSKNEKELPAAVAPSPQWIELPSDVTANILQRLEVVDIFQSAENVCTTWRKICSDPSVWRVLHIKHSAFWDEWKIDLWRRAVDRSQGQLLHLTIQDSCDDDLLNYIVYRYGFTVKALVEAFNKLPHLEELRIIYLPKIKASDIVNIGISCPVLKSFTFNPQGSTFYQPRFSHIETQKNEYAVAIAKNMPNLRHLRLITNLITNEGLEAILDGCPKLESLDLRLCPELDLVGALGKRCYEQIKRIKFPLDPVSLVEYHRALVLNNYDHPCDYQHYDD